MIKKLVERLQMAYRVFRYGHYPSMDVGESPKLQPEDISEIKQFFAMPKFFIFGHARSGTTLLARLVRLHPEVHCNWQAHFFTREPTLQALISNPQVKEWLNQKSFRWNQGRDLSPILLRVAADFIMEREASDLGKSIVGDKSPNNYKPGRSVQLLHDIYPDGKVLFIVRDGRDTILSHRIQTFIDFTEYLDESDLQLRDDFIDNPAPFFNGGRSLFTKKWLEKYIKSWTKNVSETKLQGEKLFQGQFLSVKYEDLISRPGQILWDVWNFLDVGDISDHLMDEIQDEMKHNPDAEWQKSQSSELLRHLKKGTSGKWRELFTSRDRRIVKRIAGEALISWGYEENIDW